jgi:branched-chain amino acid transport system permease protein
LPEYLPENVDIQSWRWVFFGAGLVIIMIFRPQGLFPARPPKEVLRATQSMEIPAEAID